MKYRKLIFINSHCFAKASTVLVSDTNVRFIYFIYKQSVEFQLTMFNLMIICKICLMNIIEFVFIHGVHLNYFQKKLFAHSYNPGYLYIKMINFVLNNNKNVIKTQLFMTYLKIKTRYYRSSTIIRRTIIRKIVCTLNLTLI